MMGHFLGASCEMSFSSLASLLRWFALLIFSSVCAVFLCTFFNAADIFLNLRWIS
jgi:hypothetical protein